jgi:hypothetical protein
VVFRRCAPRRLWRKGRGSFSEDEIKLITEDGGGAVIRFKRWSS